MTSVNPIYDFSEENGKLAVSKERIDFYRDCAKRGIGIHVMKVLPAVRSSTAAYRSWNARSASTSACNMLWTVPPSRAAS